MSIDANNNTNHPKLDSDEAKTSIKQDEFGLKVMVECFSKSITRRNDGKSYVIGIEGSWGSGKSSFINFVEENIREEDKSADRHIIRFEPWLIGECPALLGYFFNQLASKIDHLYDEKLGFFPTNKWRLWFKVRKLGGTIRKYGKLLSGTSDAFNGASFIDMSGTSGFAVLILKLVAEVFNFVAGILALFFPTSSLEETKAHIKNGLIELKELRKNLQIIIIVDDVDRLEAHETIEILRLVKKVADFPYITYVLNFDRKIIAEQAVGALNIADGYAYIEKIFQNIIPIPPQEPFALRRYLKKLLEESFPNEMNPSIISGIDTGENLDLETRKMYLFDQWGEKFVATPRDVVLLHEAVKFGWPHIAGKADFNDFVWLQMVKLNSPPFYEWLRNYIPSVGAYRDNGRASEDDSKREALRLERIMNEIGWDGATDGGLSYFLPGISSARLDGEQQKVFDMDADELAKFEKAKRLGSPSHWRHYFAYDKPSYAVSDDEVSIFIKKANDDPFDAVGMIKQMLDQPHEVQGHYLSVLLDRLLNIPLTPREAQGIATAFAETMDDVAVKLGRQDFGQNQIWEKTKFLMNKNVAPAFAQILMSGKSINWLSRVMRDAGFSHGLPTGNRIRPERQWLTENQLKEGVAILASRLATYKPRDLFKRPMTLDILFFWLQLGNPKDVIKYFNDAIKDDEMLLIVLNAMRGWSSNSTKGTYYPLDKKYIAYFTDVDAVIDRLQKIANPQNPNEDYKYRAQNLLESLREET